MKKSKKNVNKKVRLKIASAKIPVTVRLSFCVGIATLIAFIILCFVSAVKKGNAGVIVGIIPIVSIILNIVAFILSYKNLKREDIKVKWVLAATYINGAQVLVYMFLYIWGAIL